MTSLFGRSSSTSLFQSLHAYTMTSSTGSNDDYFYGIPLSTPTSFLEAPSWQITGCLLIIVAILLQSTGSSHRPRSSVLSFWTTILAVSIATRETTLVPLLSTVIYTRTVYPYFVVISHCVVSAASYRSRHEHDPKSEISTYYLQSLILSFFLYGFGGSIVSDLLMGLPVTALSHPRIIPCYVLGWGLVWYSPFDYVYTSYSSPSSAFRYVLKVGEAVDAITTPMGRISRGARELRNQLTAPVMGGLLAGVGGACVRQVVGEAPSPSLEGLESAFWKTLCYSLLWWYLAVHRCLVNKGDEELQQWNHCNDYNGSDLFRVSIVFLHTIWTILSEVGWVSGHPFVWMCRKAALGGLGAFFVRICRLGPPSHQDAPEAHIDDQIKVESKKND